MVAGASRDHDRPCRPRARSRVIVTQAEMLGVLDRVLGREPVHGDRVDSLVARDEDEALIRRVLEDDGVVDALAQSIDRPSDPPPFTQEPVDDRLTDVVVREEREASGHYRRACRLR